MKRCPFTYRHFQRGLFGYENEKSQKNVSIGLLQEQKATKRKKGGLPLLTARQGIIKPNSFSPSGAYVQHRWK